MERLNNLRVKCFLCFLFLFIVNVGTAQYGLDGFWVGEIITKEGIFRIEMTLEINDRSWVSKGQSVVYKRDRVIERRIFKGQLYSDRSIALEEILPNDDRLSFIRKYQLILNRTSSGSKLKGFWQEIVTDPLATKRQIGRLTLHKQKTGA